MELIFCTKQDRNWISAIQKLHDRLISKFFLSTKCLTLDNIALAVSFHSDIINLLMPILMPRYFNEFVVYNILPFNFSLKVVSVCFLIDLKRTTTALLTLRQILWALSQYERYFKSWPTYLFIFLKELKFKRFVSSAKWWTLQYYIAKWRSFYGN